MHATGSCPVALMTAKPLLVLCCRMLFQLKTAIITDIPVHQHLADNDDVLISDLRCHKQVVL